MDIHGSWPVVLMNIFPAIFLFPLIVRPLAAFNNEVKHALFAGIFVGIGLAFYTVAMLETSVLRATLLFYLTPIWSTLLGLIILSEPFTKIRVAAILVGLAGCFCLLSPGIQQAVPLNIGDIYGVSAGVFWAIGATCMKRWPQSPVLLITWFQCLSTIIVSALLAEYIFNADVPAFGDILDTLPITVVASVIILLPSTIVLMTISQILYPGRVGVLMMSEVLVAIFSASLLLP